MSLLMTLRRMGRPAPATDPADEATRPDLLKALRLIPPKLAAAIVLRHYHGYNNREIAQATGVSERTVGARLAQARLRLIRYLGPAYGRLPTPLLPGVALGDGGDA